MRARFVAPNTLSLAQAHYEPWWQPRGIYAAIDGVAVMVGFAMYGRWPTTGIPAYHNEAKPGVDFILRFMIDGRYQGRGYGNPYRCPCPGTRDCRYRAVNSLRSQVPDAVLLWNIAAVSRLWLGGSAIAYQAMICL